MTDALNKILKDTYMPVILDELYGSRSLIKQDISTYEERQERIRKGREQVLRIRNQAVIDKALLKEIVKELDEFLTTRHIYMNPIGYETEGIEITLGFATATTNYDGGWDIT